MKEAIMLVKFILLTAMSVILPIGSPATAAGIQCSGPYQVVRGSGMIATPFCEDEHLAAVARGYGLRVSGSAIRHNPSRKEEVCQAVGHDGSVYAVCLKFRNDGCSGPDC
jgi:hypothetical protein